MAAAQVASPATGSGDTLGRRSTMTNGSGGPTSPTSPPSRKSILASMDSPLEDGQVVNPVSNTDALLRARSRPSSIHSNHNSTTSASPTPKHRRKSSVGQSASGGRSPPVTSPSSIASPSEEQNGLAIPSNNTLR